MSTQKPRATAVSSVQPLDLGRSCLLVTGAPGAGKSTVTRLVASALTRSALLDGYFISTLVVSGRVWALGEPVDEATRQVALRNDNLCVLATNLADAGFTPIIDTVIPDRAQLDVFRRALQPRLRLIILDPGTDVCKRRNATRPAIDQFFFDGYAELRASMRAGFGDLGWWFDTSARTVEATVLRVLAEVNDRGLVTANHQPLPT